MPQIQNAVQIMHRLRSHPNTLRFYNWYETRNHIWVITEYCTAGDLLTVLEQDGCLPESSIKVLSAPPQTSAWN